MQGEVGDAFSIVVGEYKRSCILEELGSILKWI
jgi:hypothetical protein